MALSDYPRKQDVSLELSENKLQPEEDSKEHQLDKTSFTPDHFAVVPLLKKEKEELVEAFSEKHSKEFAKQIQTLSTQIQKLSEQLGQLKIHTLSNNQNSYQQTEKTRARLVESLMRDFRVVIIATIALVALAALGGSHVDKELIKNSVPLLINVVTGLIGAILGYYFSGNSNKN